MNKHKVSINELSILSQFGELPPNEVIIMQRDTDPNDPKSVKRTIVKYISPAINLRDRIQPGYRERLKHSLWYFLHHQHWNPAKVFNEGEPMMDEPKNLMDYYLWAWEVLFGGQESSMPEATDEYYEVVSRGH